MNCNLIRIYSEAPWDTVYQAWIDNDDVAAFSELWGRIYAKVQSRTFFKLFQSKPEAAEFAHEATVEAYVNVADRYLGNQKLREAFANQEAAENYMTTVTWHWIQSWVRKPDNRRVFRLEELEPVAAEQAVAINVDITGELETARRHKVFNRVRIPVTRQWRKSFSAKEVATRRLLRRMKGMSQTEAFEIIAEMLDLTPEGVKTRVRHSRERWERMMQARLQSAEIG